MFPEPTHPPHTTYSNRVAPPPLAHPPRKVFDSTALRIGRESETEGETCHSKFGLLTRGISKSKPSAAPSPSRGYGNICYRCDIQPRSRQTFLREDIYGEGVKLRGQSLIEIETRPNGQERGTKECSHIVIPAGRYDMQPSHRNEPPAPFFLSFARDVYANICRRTLTLTHTHTHTHTHIHTHTHTHICLSSPREHPQTNPKPSRQRYSASFLPVKGARTHLLVALPLPTPHSPPPYNHNAHLRPQLHRLSPLHKAGQANDTLHAGSTHDKINPTNRPTDSTDDGGVGGE